MRILVVDDDADARWLLCELLRRHPGWETVDRADAYQALVELRHEHFDVVVLDQMMPGATGLDLVTRLGWAGIDVPVVLVTSLVPGRVKRAAHVAGVAEVVPKDQIGDQLVPAIERATGSPAATDVG
jgi:CheY-like chemotaxis protein